MSELQLTPQQQAVVAHDHGPALVYAVAGAGKTTSILYRLERLAREKVVPADKILTTSFGVSNVRDLVQGLQRWPACRQIDVRTLHSLGWEIIRAANRLGLSELKLKREAGSIEEETRRLYFRTLATARQQQVDYLEELDGIDQADFLDYVGRCKSNLAYASLAAAELPEAGAAAQQAASPTHLKWYLDLYQLFESIRQQAQIITYDDMLMTGWELLIRHPELLSQMQNRYRLVVVDEFQDINLAQSEILDLITAPHRSYMVVGDDDQTIYEWRGASPGFILGFAGRYGAAQYVIDENFRSPAGPLLMANRVIDHNRRRQPKRLQLTRGFDGRTTVRQSTDSLQMGHDMAAEIERLIKNETPPEDIAVLVRLHGQTPPIEQALIQRRIPYRISQPFYERPEIAALVDYIRLAWVENHLRQGYSANSTMGRSAAEGWQQIANRPKRYLTREIIDDVGRRLRRLEERPSLILHRTAAKLKQEWKQTHLLELAEHLVWLSKQLDRGAHKTLKGLEGRLNYCRYLRENSGFEETGEGRALGVEAFLNFARREGTTLELVHGLKELAAERAAGRADERPSLIISTIHQAKGLEWPIVFVGQCNEGLMPFQGPLADNPEEERRLMYVALTRASRDLYVYHARDLPPSPYLLESGWEALRRPLAAAAEQIRRPPTRWDEARGLEFLRQVSELGLSGFVINWWTPDPGISRLLSQAVANALRESPRAVKTLDPRLLARFNDQSAG